MSYTPKEHMVVMLWFVLGAAILFTGVFLIGHAVHDADELKHKQELECIQANGHMERAPNNTGAIICSK